MAGGPGRDGTPPLVKSTVSSGYTGCPLVDVQSDGQTASSTNTHNNKQLVWRVEQAGLTSIRPFCGGRSVSCSWCDVFRGVMFLFFLCVVERTVVRKAVLPKTASRNVKNELFFVKKNVKWRSAPNRQKKYF